MPCWEYLGSCYLRGWYFNKYQPLEYYRPSTPPTALALPDSRDLAQQNRVPCQLQNFSGMAQRL